MRLCVVHENSVPSGAVEGRFACTTHNLIYRYTTAGGWVAWFTGAAGGRTQSYLGRTTVGGTWENLSRARAYMKKVTLSSDGMVAAISAHVRARSDSVATFAAVLHNDNSGVPGALVAYSGFSPDNTVLLIPTS